MGLGRLQELKQILSSLENFMMNNEITPGLGLQGKS